MDFFRRFMAGRYGSDQLNNALLLLGIALIIVSIVLLNLKAGEKQ